MHPSVSCRKIYIFSLENLQHDRTSLIFPYIINMFHPFRSVGLVTDSKGLSVSLHRDRSLLMVTIHRQYIIYDTQNFHVVRISEAMPSEIASFLIHHDTEYVALTNGDIHGFRCGQMLWSNKHPYGYAQNLYMSSEGNLVSVGNQKDVAIWSCADGTRRNHFSLNESMEYLSSEILPDNSILFGVFQKSIEIWGLSSGSLLHSFDVSIESGAQISRLRLCHYSPEVLSFGTSDGQVILYHMKEKKTLMKFAHSDKASVTSLSFGSEVTELMVSASSSGEIISWDLNAQVLRGYIGRKPTDSSSMERPHGLSFAEFLEHEPVILTSTPDNALRVYLYDESDRQGGLLRFRDGHAESCTLTQFIDEERVLSASSDRSLRIHHVKSANFSCALSQGKLESLARKEFCAIKDLYLPEITSIASCQPRREDWGSIITTHKNSKVVRTWRMDSLTLTKSHVELNEVQVQVVISRCGNVAGLGDVKGNIHIIYMQDCRVRNAIEHCVPSCVSKLHISACNTKMIVLSKCGTIAVIQWFSGEVVQRFNSDTVGFTSHSALHNESNLLCVGVKEGPIHAYTLCFDSYAEGSIRPARILLGHKAPLTGLVLEPSSLRFLISASIDGKIAVWDLITENCVSLYSLSSPVISLSFSPSGSFLTTAHAGNRGVFIWSSLVKYGSASEVMLKLSHSKGDIPIDTQISIIPDSGLMEELMVSKERWQVTKQYVTEKSETKVPLFKAKNVALPFFLEADGKNKHQNLSDTLSKTSTRPNKLVKDLLHTKQYSDLSEILSSKSPVEILSEFESVVSITDDALRADALPEDAADEPSSSEYIDEQKSLLINALGFLCYCLKTSNEIDKVQSNLSLFLKIYASTILCIKEECGDILSELLAHQTRINTRMSRVSTPVVSLVRCLKH